MLLNQLLSFPITEQGKNTSLKKLSASGHKIPNESLFNLGKAIASQNTLSMCTLSSIAIGDNSMGHTGVLAFTKGLTEGGGRTQLEEVDLSWKGMYVSEYLNSKKRGYISSGTSVPN